MTGIPVPPALAAWTETLRAAGVPSPVHDARALVAVVLGVPPLRVPMAPAMSREQQERAARLVARRAGREPLQHILGTAGFFGLELAVGPGVFVPRPETEALAGFVVEWLLDRPAPQTVVDLCAGSGALALAIGCAVPGARVTGVELSQPALEYARANLQRCRSRLAGSSVELIGGDATDPGLLGGLSGRVDAVVTNPPYIPAAAVPREPEVRDHDPDLALYGGADGLDVVRGLLPVARRLLRPGGLLAVEHGDEQSGADGVPGVLAGPGSGFGAVDDHTDLAGRPRFTTAVRLG